MVLTWSFCDREFDSSKKLEIHLSRTALKTAQLIQRNKIYSEDITDEVVYSDTQEQLDTMLILMQEKLPVAGDVNLIQAYLPQYKTIKRIPNHPRYSLKCSSWKILMILIMESLHGGKICWNFPQKKHLSYLSGS